MSFLTKFSYKTQELSSNANYHQQFNYILYRMERESAAFVSVTLNGKQLVSLFISATLKPRAMTARLVRVMKSLACCYRFQFFRVFTPYDD